MITFCFAGAGERYQGAGYAGAAQSAVNALACRGAITVGTELIGIVDLDCSQTGWDFIGYRLGTLSSAKLTIGAKHRFKANLNMKIISN